MDKSASEESSGHSCNVNEDPGVPTSSSGSSLDDYVKVSSDSFNKDLNMASSDPCTASEGRRRSSIPGLIRTKMDAFFSRHETKKLGYVRRSPEGWLEKEKYLSTQSLNIDGPEASSDGVKASNESSSEDSNKASSASGGEPPSSGIKTKIVEYFSRYDIKKFGYGLRLQEEERLERERKEKEKEKEQEQKPKS